MNQPRPNPLLDLDTAWAVRLTTFRRDGTPVSTPVNVALDDGRIFFRTFEQSGKFKRLRNNHRVEVAPSNARGDVKGESIAATAQLLTGADDRRAAALIDGKHRIFQRIVVRFGHRVRRLTTRHFELLPVTT